MEQSSNETIELVCDLHIHSKYSRMTSPQMEPATIHAWAAKKGMDIIATGDWTHPEWLQTLQEELAPAEDGLFVLRDVGDVDAAPRFILSGEIACVHPGRSGNARIRHVVLLPSFEAAEAIATQLGWIGNLRSDGRPILGLHSQELVDIVFSVTDRAVVFPAHVWVPNLSVLGMGGFDRIADCYGEATDRIVALETGLSSDPPMNWRCSFLDRFTLLSNSDAHSPHTIGREATVLDVVERSYDAIVRAIHTNAVVETVEFFPEEGRYHAIGHADCEVVMTPKEAATVDGVCPECQRRMTVGVEGRVAELADRSIGYERPDAPPFRRLLGLDVLIAEALGSGIDTKGVQEQYERLIRRLGDEFHILRNVDIETIGAESLPQIATAVDRIRNEDITITPGYDGEFGSIELFTAEERVDLAPQQSLF